MRFYHVAVSAMVFCLVFLPLSSGIPQLTIFMLKVTATTPIAVRVPTMPGPPYNMPLTMTMSMKGYDLYW